MVGSTAHRTVGAETPPEGTFPLLLTTFNITFWMNPRCVPERLIKASLRLFSHAAHGYTAGR